MAILVGVLLVAALVGLAVVIPRWREQQREVERVRALFSRYVPPPVVAELLRRKDPRLYSGRSMHATTLVCRIKNFAGFAERLTPEETLRYLNEFFAIAGTSIHKHGGMIDKFLSDGVIGAFGVPIEDPFQEEHALRAALDIVRLVDAMDRRWQSQGRRSIQVGIGVASGTVIAGDAGYHDRREFTVVGPETLFAASLQEATSALNASIVASAATGEAVRELFTLVPVQNHPLPGLKRLADAFIVRGLKKHGVDDLRMPAAAAFVETQLERPSAAADAAPVPPVPAPVAPARAATPVRAAPPPVSPPASAPAATVDAAPFDVPDFAIQRYRRAFDDAPILPDPPAPRADYEDGDGPPIRLGP